MADKKQTRQTQQRQAGLGSQSKNDSPVDKNIKLTTFVQDIFVDPHIWYDAKFRLLSGRAKFIFFWCHAHPNHAPDTDLSAEFGITAKEFAAAIDEIAAAGIDAKYCWPARRAA